ncbi:hypothetical protein U1Q18_048817 [Sarracenia purpurea var. burkii]
MLWIWKRIGNGDATALVGGGCLAIWNVKNDNGNSASRGREATGNEIGGRDVVVFFFIDIVVLVRDRGGDEILFALLVVIFVKVFFALYGVIFKSHHKLWRGIGEVSVSLVSSSSLSSFSCCSSICISLMFVPHNKGVDWKMQGMVVTKII